MKHQSGRKKLNLSVSHKKALIRNQTITLIEKGHLNTTKARAREVIRFAERLVTLARDGNTVTARRRAKALLPYKESALVTLFKEIAPRYTDRPGGYIRMIKLGRRASDTSEMARVEWV